MNKAKSKEVQGPLYFTQEQCSRLISFIKENELYKESHRKPNVRKKLWHDISLSLGKDGG